MSHLQCKGRKRSNKLNLESRGRFTPGDTSAGILREIFMLQKKKSCCCWRSTHCVNWSWPRFLICKTHTRLHVSEERSVWKFNNFSYKDIYHVIALLLFSMCSWGELDVTTGEREDLHPLLSVLDMTTRGWQSWTFEPRVPILFLSCTCSSMCIYYSDSSRLTSEKCSKKLALWMFYGEIMNINLMCFGEKPKCKHNFIYLQENSTGTL